jgi:4-amino-4-deoxy-L-arabinose transferase-like glycosyltransferase
VAALDDNPLLTQPRHLKPIAAYVLVGLIVVLAAWLHVYGLRGDLPWAYESDEGEFAVLAIRMANNGDPNPNWFGHPASTSLYPLALIFHVGNALEAGLPLWQVDPGLAARVGGNPGKYFWLARLLSVFYAVAALPLVYGIARRAFDPTIGVLATWLALLSPMSLSLSQMIRSDSAGLFFGLLALWLVLRVLERPTLGRHVAAGLGIGAAIGTRYFLVVTVPSLLCIDLLLWWRAAGLPGERTRLLRAAIAALACTALGFFLTTPYFVLHFPTVWGNLAHEMREEHLGADGLDFLGNLRWYLTDALPQSMPVRWLGFAVVGASVAAWRRNVPAGLVALPAVLFLIAISTASLHWTRWLMQILPLIAMFAAAGLVCLARLLAHGVGKLSARAGTVAAPVLVVLLALLFTAGPAIVYYRAGIVRAAPGTRVLARQWIEHNVPAGSRIVADFYTAPLHDTEVTADYHFALAADGTLEQYRTAGYQYAMISDAIYLRFFREAKRYPREVKFYESLLKGGKLVQRFAPANVRRGPTISLYSLE